MTGRIRLYNADGSRYVSPTTTQEDYVLPPIQPDRNDMLCSTVGTSPYHPPLGNGQLEAREPAHFKRLAVR